MLEKYAKDNGFSNTVHYTDDGYSGGNFERPSWKQLVSDIEENKVDCVIVKDMSRIGRDYLQTGFYTEVLFRQQNVRFIAISNGVDSNIEGSNEFAPFLNIMNEWYLRDCSRKQKAAYQARGNSGKHTANVAIYGYKKDPEDKHHWLIDEEAAEIVRRIYNLSVEGYGVFEISNILTKDKIETPAHYLAKRGLGTQQHNIDENHKYDWSCSTVANIIAKPEYMGHTVNFRYYKKHYKDKHQLKRPPEEWVIFENTHEAIVDKETWELAQKLRKTVRRTDTTGAANPLTGLVYCADCGAKMYNHRGRAQADKENRGADPVSGLLPYDHYDCSTYSLTYRRTNKECFGHHVSTKAIRAIILETIKLVSQYAISDKEEFVKKVRSAAEVQQLEAAKKITKQLKHDKKRFDELDGIIKKLYESYATGKITENRFETLCAEYEQEQADLRTVIENAEKEIESYTSDTERIDSFMALAKKYTDFSVLTNSMINEFVDKIIVHAPEKVNGERTQEIEVYLKFIGKFDVPMPEPTAEELEEQEKQRQKRAYYRERGRRQRERERERKRLAAEAAEITEEKQEHSA